jgi:hypothetical protein
MLVDHKMIFAMFLLCYAWHLNYYVSMYGYFAALRSISYQAMLEKILGVGSFGGFINHMTRCQATFFLFFWVGSTSL